MRKWQSDGIAVAAGLAALIVLAYGLAATILVVRLMYPSYDQDVVGLETDHR